MYQVSVSWYFFLHGISINIMIHFKSIIPTPAGRWGWLESTLGLGYTPPTYADHYGSLKGSWSKFSRPQALTVDSVDQTVSKNWKQDCSICRFQYYMSCTLTGCLQIQLNKFPEDFQDTVPAGFLHRSSLRSITTWDTNTCTFGYARHQQKMVKWQFLGFKDVTRFGSVIGILLHFSWKVNFQAASVKFPGIVDICKVTQ